MVHERAGQKANASDLVDVSALIDSYFSLKPDATLAEQKVTFGTSGHRGSSFATSFNEDHILAITQAVVDYRNQQGFGGPVFVGRDTHALSEPAQQSVLEVLAGNGVIAKIDSADRYTPTPAVSVASLITTLWSQRTPELSRTASSSPQATTPLRMAESNTTHLTVDLPTLTPQVGLPIELTSCCFLDCGV